MDCSVCGKLGNPYCYISASNEILQENLQTCMLYELLQLSKGYRVCRDCCEIVERCATGIYHMRRIYVFLTNCFTDGLCFVCQSLKVHEYLDITKGDMEYEILLRLVGEFQDGDVDVCKACYELVSDLAELHRMVLHANPELTNYHAINSQTASVKRSKPVDISGQNLHCSWLEPTGSQLVENQKQITEKFDDSWCMFPFDPDLDSDNQQTANVERTGSTRSHQGMSRIPESSSANGSIRRNKNIFQTFPNSYSSNPVINNSTLKNPEKNVFDQKKIVSKIKHKYLQAIVPSCCII